MEYIAVLRHHYSRAEARSKVGLEAIESLVIFKNIIKPGFGTAEMQNMGIQNILQTVAQF
jgi:hypothetical protein